MGGNREIYIKARLDYSKVGQDAREGAQSIARELGRLTDESKKTFEKLWAELKNDRGAFASLKAQVDKFVSDLATSGGKLKVPTEQIVAASRATSQELDKLAQQNAAKLEQLYPYLDQLKAKMQEAMKSGDSGTAAQAQKTALYIQNEIKQREKLNLQIRDQYVALEKLVGIEVLEGRENTIAARGQQTLSQQLADTKRRMDELAQSGKAGTSEYDNLKNKARDLAEQIKQLNQDSTPEAQVRFRTALMNVKNEMMKLKKEGKENTEQYRMLQQEAVKLQQAMNSANKQIKNMANPNATFQGIISGISGISGVLSAATGAMALFGEKNEDVQKIMMKLQGVMSITMGLQSLSTALNKNSAFQLNIVGRLTNWWASCKAKAAAAIATETSMIASNTAAVTASSSATAKATAANTAHAFSWKAVGIAIKSVPIWGWVITALTALATVIGVVVHKITKLTNAQQAMKDVMKQANAETIKGKNNLDLLYKAATSVNNAMEVRLAAIDKLKSDYPQYFQKLKDEAILVGEAADAYDLATAAIKKNAIAKGMQTKIDEYGTNIAKWYSDHFEEEQYLDENKEKYEKLRKKYTDKRIANLPQKKTYRTVGSGKYAHTVEGFEYANQEDKEAVDFIYEYENRQKAYNQSYEKKTKNDREKMEFLSKELEKRADDLLMPTHEQKRAATEGDPLYYKRLAEEALSRADDHTLTKEERTKAQQDYKKYQKLYENARFDPKDRTAAAGGADIADQKAEDADTNARRERAKAILKIDQELEQRRIDIMEDGAEKRARQRRLDNQKEIDSLDDAMQQEIAAEVERQKKIWDAAEEAKAKAAAAQGKQYRKKAFSSGEMLTSNIVPGETIGEKSGQRKVNTGNIETKAINTIIAKYGAMEDILLLRRRKRLEEQAKAERLAMDEYIKEYGTTEEKIEAINRIYAEKKKNATTEGEAMRIQQEWLNALNKVEFEDFMKYHAALAFGEVEKLSSDTLEKLIKEMEEYRSKVIKTFDPQNIAKFEEALARLKEAKAINSKSPLSSYVPEYFRERAAAQAELEAAEKRSNDLAAEKAKKEQEVADKVQKIIDKVKQLTGIEITDAQVKDGTTLNGIVGSLNANGETAAASEIQTETGELGNMRVQLNNVSEAANEAANNYANLNSQFNANYTGSKGALGAIGGAVGKLSEELQKASSIMQGLSQIAGALGGDTSVGSGWDTATTLISTFAGAADGAKNAIASIQSGDVLGAVQGVTQSFTSLINGFASLNDASHERTIQRLQKEIENLDRINRRIDRQVSKQYSREAASSYEELIKNTRKQIECINDQIDEERSKKNPDKDRIQEWEDQVEQLWYQIEDYKDAVIDVVVGEDIKSSIGNFADMLAEAWGNSQQAAREAKQYAKEMMRQMVIEAMKTDLTEPVRKLRQMMSTAMDDGIVTNTEKESMEKFAQKMAENIQYRYEWASNILDIGTTGQSGGDRGDFATASQDSITELNGRFAALHTSVEAARATLNTMQIDTTGIREALVNQSRMAQETRDLQIAAVGHLETISRNTHQLYEMNERLGKIEKNTQSL